MVNTKLNGKSVSPESNRIKKKRELGSPPASPLPGVSTAPMSSIPKPTPSPKKSVMPKESV